MQLNRHSALATAIALFVPLVLAAQPDEVRPLPTGNEKPSEAPRKPLPKPDAAKPADAKPAEPKAAEPKPAASAPVVVMKTSLGEIKIKLNPEKAPVTVENFLKYVDQKFFDGTIFHRVIANFMIQGGGFTPDMTQKKTMAPIVLEAANGLLNQRGTIAMARTNDPNSATAQFFINVVDNAMLNYKPGPGGEGYAVFGEVIDGMAVVDQIKAVKTGTENGMQNVPVEKVTIESVRRAE